VGKRKQTIFKKRWFDITRACNVEAIFVLRKQW
jgi:hypothetical protein